MQSVYRYKLEEDYSIDTPWLEDCEHPYCSVKDGVLTIEKHYAWNGCSPCFSVLKLFYITTPDGIIDYRTGKPVTYYASLVHDCLCQYKLGTRKDADVLFYNMLCWAGFPLARVYYAAVRLFGREWR